MKENPKISVVTVCYNAVDTIEKTILSVINQTYQNIEYIIIDGASTDGTVDIINKYRDKIGYFVSEPDKGIYNAMNKGIKVATGEWINFMNAGDAFFSNSVVTEVVKNIEKGSIIIYGDTMVHYSEGKKLYKPIPLDNIEKKMFFNHQSSFANTACMKNYLFDESYKLCADYKFHYDIYKKGMKFQYVQVVIANYDGQNGASSTHYPLLLKEYGRVQGRTKSPKWNVFCYFKIFLYYLKSMIKMFVPEQLLKKKRLYDLHH